MDKRLTLALKYYQSNLDDQAWDLVEELVNEPDPSTDVLSMAATMSFERRDLKAALGFCDRLLSLNAGDAHTLLIKGRALSDLNRPDDALNCLKEAIRIDESLAAAHFNLGWVYQSKGECNHAIAAYRAAVSRQDPYPVAWNNLGLMLEQEGDGKGAIQAFRTAIRQFPAFSAAHNNLGAVFAAGGQFHQAAAAYKEALDVAPDNLDAKVNLGVALLEEADITGAVDMFEAVLAEDPDHAAAMDNLLYAELYRRDNDEVLRAAHATFGDRYQPARTASECLRVPDPERILKVGFLSPDFRRHSVSFFSLPLIEALSGHAVEPHLFNDTANTDAITNRFRAAAEVWHDVATLSDEDLTTYLCEQNLDVLVDLAGHTTGNRLRALSSRVAPIQITALGYPGPSGLPAMDHWLCDGVTNPPVDNATHDRDKPLRLDSGLHVFAPPSDSPGVSPLPASKSGSLTFGSFNKLAKVSDACADLWADALKAVEGSRLLLKTRALTEEETAQTLRTRFEKAGVDPARIETRGWTLEDRDHLALYHHIDVALDTVPYNGTTTTCEALWMGVPVLTLAGQGHAARVGASLLTSAGLQDWIASSTAEFVDMTKAKAADLEGLRDLRAGLRSQVSCSALTDGPANARAFESALRVQWRDLCADAKG